MNREVYWCDGCKRRFPLKQLKGCRACRIAKYCSAACQAIAWKDEHKRICQKIVVQKDLLQGWAHTWVDLKWITVFALDFDNRPGNHRDRCLEIQLRKTGSDNLSRAYEVLNGRFGPVDRERPHNQPQLTLLVKREEGEPIEVARFVWDLSNLFPDPPERPEKWEKYCVEVFGSVVTNSKPRHALRMLTMKTVLLREELGLPPWMLYMNAGD